MDVKGKFILLLDYISRANVGTINFMKAGSFFSIVHVANDGRKGAVRFDDRNRFVNDDNLAIFIQADTCLNLVLAWGDFCKLLLCPDGPAGQWGSRGWLQSQVVGGHDDVCLRG
jgi:hypothetical protein